jgi:hypothetical protein
MTSEDLVASVFDRSTVGRLRDVPNPSGPQRFRLDVISAPPSVSPKNREDGRVCELIARRNMWNNYFLAAKQIGFFDDDLQQRLRHSGHDQFRGAWAECLAAWFLTSELNLKVSPRPPGKDGKRPDLQICVGDMKITTEIKSPFREFEVAELASGTSMLRLPYGVAHQDLESALVRANKQFHEMAANLLVIVPWFWLGHKRVELVNAFFGEEVFVLKVDIHTGEAVENGTGLLENGLFLRPDRDKTRFTRIGAVLVIEEKPSVGINHAALLLHNPHAKVSLPEGIWGDIPQFVARGGHMFWTDGETE